MYNIILKSNESLRHIYIYIYNPFINHVLEKTIQGMVVEMVFNNKIQILFSK